LEAALDVLARRVGAPVGAAVAAEPDVTRFAFDARRRMMSVVTETRVLVKGAPASVLERYAPRPAEADAALAELSARGLRVLAVAARSLARVPVDPDDAERDLTLRG